MGPDEAPRVEDLPQVIPLFPLDGALVLPTGNTSERAVGYCTL